MSGSGRVVYWTGCTLGGVPWCTTWVVHLPGTPGRYGRGGVVPRDGTTPCMYQSNSSRGDDGGGPSLGPHLPVPHGLVTEYTSRCTSRLPSVHGVHLEVYGLSASVHGVHLEVYRSCLPLYTEYTSRCTGDRTSCTRSTPRGVPETVPSVHGVHLEVYWR